MRSGVAASTPSNRTGAPWLEATSTLLGAPLRRRQRLGALLAGASTSVVSQSVSQSLLCVTCSAFKRCVCVPQTLQECLVVFFGSISSKKSHMRDVVCFSLAPTLAPTHPDPHTHTTHTPHTHTHTTHTHTHTHTHTRRYNMCGGLVSVVAGGYANTVTASFAVIAGGRHNTISGGGSSVVGGGWSNTVSEVFAVVSGGFENTATHQTATVAGGRGNLAGTPIPIGSPSPSPSSGPAPSVYYRGSAVGGGWDNTAAGSWSVVSGGQRGITQGAWSVVGGGRECLAVRYIVRRTARGVGCTHSHTRTHARARTHTHSHARTHARTHTYRRTRAHTRPQTHAHTHAHTPAFVDPRLRAMVDKLAPPPLLGWPSHVLATHETCTVFSCVRACVCGFACVSAFFCVCVCVGARVRLRVCVRCMRVGVLVCVGCVCACRLWAFLSCRPPRTQS